MNGTIRIVGAHDHGDGKPEIVKSEHKAHYTQENLNYIITYSDDVDTSEDSADSSAKVYHRLEIGEGYLRMMQTGDINSDLLFRLGEIWKTDYQTPYGLMKMTAITRHLMLEISSKKISAHVQYELQMDGEKISDSKVRISFIPD
ncbi:DUF1934 domain-containing protein [Butyrivibrio sp. AC2005]|uniref:DUF1934 domain-containing protein n=1 Tax=Butyrivibrio sp. AC2005 TaxID=1280672 RepID=UPI0004285BBB|nr:DUF1934 domain-containing protein [Butyrivibrio sp. AC2005]